jgi:hypothetical protein
MNSISDHYHSYLGDFYHGKKPASRVAAAAQAAHDVLTALYPQMTPLFESALNETLARVKNQNRENRGVRVGERAAEAVLTLRADDNNTVETPYMPTGDPGNHDVDPDHPLQGFYGPSYGDVTPWVIESSDQFQAPPPPALDSQEYTDAYNEVMTLGGDGVITATTRTEEQTEIGIFWGYDKSPGLGAPPRMYNQIVRTIAIQQGNNPMKNARLFALVNLAMADAGIAAWESKYEYDFWRPIIAIREGDMDTNDDTDGDATWTPLGAPASNQPGATNFTPPFPAYVSGHATFGAAMFQVLARFYGTDDIAFSFMSDEFNGLTVDQDGTTRPMVARSFDNLSQAKMENAESRIYLGIHWRFDATQGIAMGDAVGNYVYENALQKK